MFERYTEKARRVIFFSRYEASQFGSPAIETEHILLGLLREDKALSNRLWRSHAETESIRRQIEQHSPVREKTLTSVDLPLSDECKRVLLYASEEAERFGHLHIGTEHLLLGLLREARCFAATLLAERGVRLDAIREDLTKSPHTGQAAQSVPAPQRPNLHPLFTGLGRFELALHVADLNASLRFYEALGFQPVRGSVAERGIVVQNGDCRIALHQDHIAETF